MQEKAGGAKISFTKLQSATPESTRARRLISWIAIPAFLADLTTKLLAVQLLESQQSIPLLGGLLSLRLVRNPGAAFSLGENATVLFSGVSMAALLFVLIWLVPRVRHRLWAIATGLLVAGIVGNLVDRLFRAPGPMRGHVVDFIAIPHFAIVNVADICITVAAGLIIFVTAIREVGLGAESVESVPKDAAP